MHMIFIYSDLAYSVSNSVANETDADEGFSPLKKIKIITAFAYKFMEFTCL